MGYFIVGLQVVGEDFLQDYFVGLYIRFCGVAVIENGFRWYLTDGDSIVFISFVVVS